MLPDPLPADEAVIGYGKSVDFRSRAARLCPIASTSGLDPTRVMRVARVSSNGAPPASVSNAGEGMIRGTAAPDTGEGGVAGAGGLQPDTIAAPANAKARFEDDNSPPEHIQCLPSLGMCTNLATVISE